MKRTAVFISMAADKPLAFVEKNFKLAVIQALGPDEYPIQCDAFIQLNFDKIEPRW
jgi:hypothetical protein